MGESFVTRGFRGKRPPEDVRRRLPPGQYLEQDFPVLTAGPTPRLGTERWDLRLVDPAGRVLSRWTWEEFRALPRQEFTCDIHCVTQWSKLDTSWSGVSLDVLLEGVDVAATPWLVAACEGGYTTNLPLAEVLGGRAWVVDTYGGEPLAPEHGGPARMLVPALYLWKSAKWVRELRLALEDRPGFWETRGYHNHGDPWKQERYW